MSNIFSIDYRSPPSGLGQIVNPAEPDTPENMILISYNGCGSPKNPYYREQLHLGDVWDDQSQSDLLIQFLKSKQVTEVYDVELGFAYPKDCDSKYHFKLEDWIRINFV